VGRYWALAALVGAAAACIGPQPFACTDDAQCRLDGIDGWCEPERFCSYPDDECGSNRRFESEAPGDLGGECVDMPGTSDGETDESTSQTDAGSESGSDVSDSGDTSISDECVPFDMVRGGVRHTCARDVEGNLWCWGENLFGQQGPPRTNFIVEPTRVQGVGPIVAFDTSDHTCAIEEGGDLLCWGRNENGQVDPTDELPVLEDPLVIADVPGEVNSFATGLETTCASVDSELYCWGQILGMPGIEATAIPGIAEPLVAMQAGRAHACGLTEDGRAWCWGDDDAGQLGDGGGVGNGEAVPVEFIEDGVVHALDVGSDHACAVFDGDDGLQVRCWGDNSVNQTGLLLGAPVPFPHTPVGNLIGGQYGPLTAGIAHSCVWAGDEGMFCWGDNSVGQSQWDPTIDWLDGPNAVALPFETSSEVAMLSGGGAHTCLLQTDGTLDCWGCNTWGQLGAEPRGCEPDDVVTVRVCARG